MTNITKYTKTFEKQYSLVSMFVVSNVQTQLCQMSVIFRRVYLPNNLCISSHFQRVRPVFTFEFLFSEHYSNLFRTNLLWHFREKSKLWGPQFGPDLQKRKFQNEEDAIESSDSLVQRSYCTAGQSVAQIIILFKFYWFECVYYYSPLKLIF